MAHRALGFAAAADAELAEPAAGLPLSGRRSRRLPDACRRSSSFIDGLRQGDLGAGADPHDRHLGAPHRRRDISCAPIRATGDAGRSCSRPAPATSPACPAFADQVPRVDRASDGAALSQSRPARRRWRPGRGRIVERHPDRQRNPPLGPPGDACRWASTSARRASIAARTWSGGWTPPACSTSATTRSTTSRGRDGCRRCSLPARPTARRSTSMP